MNLKDLQTPMYLLSIVSVLVLPFAHHVSKLDIWLYRKLGWNDLADRWERRLSWWVPLQRGIVALIAGVAITILYCAGRVN